MNITIINIDNELNEATIRYEKPASVFSTGRKVEITEITDTFSNIQDILQKEITNRTTAISRLNDSISSINTEIAKLSN